MFIYSFSYSVLLNALNIFLTVSGFIPIPESVTDNRIYFTIVPEGEGGCDGDTAGDVKITGSAFMTIDPNSGVNLSALLRKFKRT